MYLNAVYNEFEHDLFARVFYLKIDKHLSFVGHGS